MATFVNTVVIDRPAAEVFAFLADFENIPAWNYAIQDTIKTSPGPAGVGSTYRQTRSVPGRSEEGFEVTVFEPVSQLAIEGQLGPFRTRASYRLEPRGSATRLVNEIDIEASSAARRLVASLAVSRIKAAVAANLTELKRLLER
jgi:Polyketide cyclase / dehydrase and lipid transport